MTQEAATTSSSKSGASAPSVINSSSSAVTFLAYSSLACSGIVAGRFSGEAIVTPCLTTVWPGSVSSQLPPVSPARSTTTLPGFMPSHGRGGHQARRRPSRHQGGGDHHVELGDRLLERLLLLRAFLVGQLAGVAALTGRVDPQVEPLRADRADLIGHLGAHVVAGGLGAETLGGGQRLQARHADAEHQQRRRLHRARGGGQHRKEPGRLRRRQHHGLVAGHVGLRRQRIHHLRPRDPRNRLHRKGGHVGEAQPFRDLRVRVAGRGSRSARILA